VPSLLLHQKIEADRAAAAPSPAEMTACLYGLLVASPAAKSPGIDAWLYFVDNDLAVGERMPRSLKKPVAKVS
jgi:hypothetical protein